MEFICPKCSYQHTRADLAAEQNHIDPEVIEVFICCAHCGHERSALVEIADFTSEDDSPSDEQEEEIVVGDCDEEVAGD
jgi:hypothetical protein